MDYICKYCGKECKNTNSLRNHERLCKSNPNRQESPFVKYNKTKGDVWNKGLTKDTDERVRNNGASISKGYKSGRIKNWCDGLTKDTDERLLKLSNKISKTVSAKVKNDTWHNSFGKSKIVIYNDIDFHGHWEVEFAKYLDNLQIDWIRNTDKFKYKFDNKTRYYTPDFYIPDLDLYIEIKGYPTEKDFRKWDSFPADKKLNIYFGDELFDLGIIDGYRNVYNNVLPKYRIKHKLQ